MLRPCPRSAVSTKSPVQHHTVALRQYEGVLVTQRVRQTADEAEQTVSPRRYVGAVLDVGFRPKLRRFRIIAPVEKGIECLQNNRFGFLSRHDFSSTEGLERQHVCS